ncbi:MAG: hypothetical protein CVU98_08620 [Firmicutes bacterium HGW-Firmicutes-3]|jgi:hypothetical protein|nr:MAG: hypothetical protein CVU98_08620 [Firmicutes bacterium HGW-Firmicutes-3]
MKKWMIFGILIIVVGLFSGCFNSKPVVVDEEPAVSDIIEEETTEEPSEEVTEDTSEDALPEEEEAILEDEMAENMETATGIYVGQIDSNSIEVELTDTSAENAFKAFRFSETVKANFGDYKLTEGVRIRISYTLDENNASIIHDIEKVE